MSNLRIRWSRFGKQERLCKRIGKISSVGIRSIPTLERFFRHLKFKQLKQHKMTTQEKVAHLNKLTMSALTLNEGNVTDMDDELYEYIQDLRSEGIVVQVGDNSYVYSEDEMRVVDRLLAWLTQILHAEKLIESEDEEVFDQFPDLHLDLIREAITGLAVCYNQNPDGINFFIAEGDTIVLVRSPYFLFEESLRNKTGINYTEFNLDSVIKGGSVF